MRVERDLPGMAVEIGEVARVTTPERVVSGLQDRGTCRFRLSEDAVNLGLIATVVGKRDAAKLGVRCVVVKHRVLCQRLSRIESHHAALQLKEDDVAAAGLARLPTERLVEFARASEVAN